MLSYLFSNLSVRMMLARVVQLGATYTGPRFEFVVSCEYITVRHLRQLSTELPHGRLALLVRLYCIRLVLYIVHA